MRIAPALAQPGLQGDAAELRDRLAKARSQDEKLNLLARAAVPRLSSEDAIAPGLAFAFRRLSRADVRIADVAREVGMSREGFSKAFRREFGLSPKTFARVRRFARTLDARERAVSQRGRARRAMRIRRPGPHDPRIPGILWQRALRAVAAGTARRRRIHRLSESSHFHKTAASRAPNA